MRLSETSAIAMLTEISDALRTLACTVPGAGCILPCVVRIDALLGGAQPERLSPVDDDESGPVPAVAVTVPTVRGPRG